jgi:hypothetical protein
MSEAKLSMRKVASVSEGIVKSDAGGDFVALVYEPGNATRYVVLLSNVGEKLSEETLGGFGGATKDMSLVTLMNFRGGPRSMFVAHHDDHLHWSRVAEKLSLGEADARVMTELICWMVAVPSPNAGVSATT